MSHTLTMIPPLSSWPWGNFGVYKYVLYGPLVAKVIHSKPWEGEGKDLWCLHLLIICGLRGLVFTLWSSFSNMLFLIRRRRILQDGVGFKQIDAEWDWDNGLILHTLMGALTCYFFPNLKSTPLWNSWGLPLALAIHALISEPLFYLFHKIFHSDYFFKDYHSIHHSSPVPQPFTAGFATPLEHVVLGVVMGVPILGCFLIGVGSAGLVYVYVLMFDFLRCMGHSNVEVFPSGLFESFPFMRYLIYTPTYHSLHHTEKETNFCLFMPIFDVIGGTLNCKSWELQKEISSGKIEKVPDFVFLAHVVHIVHGTHSCFIFRSFASIPYRFQPFLVVLWPGIFLLTIMMLAFSKTFTVAFYNLRGKQHQTWLVPRCGIHYFLSFCLKGINDQIEMGIKRADKIGVKVISLGALNKNEALNGGGTLFVNKHPDLKIRVVHGNTLTAAVILNEIPKNVEEVFLTGATSKLGRAIALYLCRKKITVLMLTPSSERFQKIQKEAPAEYQPYLVQVTKYQAAQNCKTWIVGKWIKPKEQNCAPAGTHFHQFVVPPISSLRRDCTYGKLAAMRLPEDVEGLNMCEISLERGVVHACHAGGVVHFLEDYKHHEVGAIDVDRIDMVWEAAMKHGLKPV